MSAKPFRWAAIAAASAALPTAASAQFTNDNTAPNEFSRTENVDFGDVDLDGDWDAVFADGGDFSQDQNRIWINQGGLQGGTVGSFVDDTAARMPAANDQSRDIEFADIEHDGDIDLYISNTAQLQNQGNRWWVNMGNLQGGTLGHFVDETGARWVGLNSANSSVADSLLLPDEINPETFIDWSCDCDFADMDNDGDLDLFHSTYGGAFGGNVPSRIYLNDGDGFFEEFNPSGFKLGGQNINPGDPAIWAEGTQETNTDSVDGTHADVASSALDIDLMDFDGDFDIDILHGSRQTETRLFRNQLEENGGVLIAFRDESELRFPGSNWASGGNNYEQEMGDIDNDGDIDIYGLNWSGFNDTILYNDGTGMYSGTEILPSSGADDNEGDFLDYDNDGDLDLYVANFSGTNKLYRNQFVETGSVNYVIQQTGLGNGTTLDADAADVDNDGDLDFINAQDGNNDNDLFINTLNIPDTHAPYFSYDEIEQVSNGNSAEADDEVVRALVNDNVPYYINWYNKTSLHVSVDDGVNVFELPPTNMVSSGGQVFRGTIPSNLIGDMSYFVTSTDHNNLTGTSLTRTYTNAGNTEVEGGVTSPSSVGTPRVQGLSDAKAGKPMVLGVSGIAPGAGGLLLASNSSTNGLNLGDGAVLNILPPFLAAIPLTANASGLATLVAPTQPGLAGVDIFVQFLALDGVGGDTWASSNRVWLNFN